MYACVCNAVTEREVEQAISEGAQTASQIRKRLDVPRICGSCDDCLQDHIARACTPACPDLSLAIAE